MGSTGARGERRVQKGLRVRGEGLEGTRGGGWSVKAADKRDVRRGWEYGARRKWETERLKEEESEDEVRGMREEESKAKY